MLEFRDQFKFVEIKKDVKMRSTRYFTDMSEENKQYLEALYSKLQLMNQDERYDFLHELSYMTELLWSDKVEISMRLKKAEDAISHLPRAVKPDSPNVNDESYI